MLFCIILACRYYFTGVAWTLSIHISVMLFSMLAVKVWLVMCLMDIFKTFVSIRSHWTMCKKMCLLTICISLILLDCCCGCCWGSFYAWQYLLPVLIHVLVEHLWPAASTNLVCFLTWVVLSFLPNVVKVIMSIMSQYIMFSYCCRMGHCLGHIAPSYSKKLFDQDHIWLPLSFWNRLREALASWHIDLSCQLVTIHYECWMDKCKPRRHMDWSWSNRFKNSFIPYSLSNFQRHLQTWLCECT